jgi:hypothetical protein
MLEKYNVSLLILSILYQIILYEDVINQQLYDKNITINQKYGNDIKL